MYALRLLDAQVPGHCPAIESQNSLHLSPFVCVEFTLGSMAFHFCFCFLDKVMPDS